jgi:hypothetical protein
VQIGRLTAELASCQSELEQARRGGALQEMLEKKQEALTQAAHETDALKIQVACIFPYDRRRYSHMIGNIGAQDWRTEMCASRSGSLAMHWRDVCLKVLKMCAVIHVAKGPARTWRRGLPRGRVRASRRPRLRHARCS